MLEGMREAWAEYRTACAERMEALAAAPWGSNKELRHKALFPPGKPLIANPNHPKTWV